jgi:hypothetical protein
MVDPDSSPAIASIQPEMEVPDRSRNPGKGYECRDSVGQNELNWLIQFRSLWTGAVAGTKHVAMRPRT